MLGLDVVLGVGLLLGLLVFFCPFRVRRVLLSPPLFGPSAAVVGNEFVAVVLSELVVAPRLLRRRGPPFKHAILICPPYTPLQQASIVV